MTDEATRPIQVEVNGRPHDATVPVRKTLSDFLRQDLKLTGTHLGCEHGVCGACTVLLDGRAVRSCLMLAVQADGMAVQTVEGLAPSPTELHPLQQGLLQPSRFAMRLLHAGHADHPGRVSEGMP